MHELGCKDMGTSTSMGMSTGTGTIQRHEQFLKNYNKIRLIGYCYNMSTIHIRHRYDTPNEVSLLLSA